MQKGGYALVTVADAARTVGRVLAIIPEPECPRRRERFNRPLQVSSARSP